MINAKEARDLAVKKSFEVLKDIDIDTVITVIHSCAEQGGLSCEYYDPLIDDQIFKLNLLGFKVKDKSYRVPANPNAFINNNYLKSIIKQSYIISW